MAGAKAGAIGPFGTSPSTISDCVGVIGGIEAGNAGEVSRDGSFAGWVVAGCSAVGADDWALALDLDNNPRHNTSPAVQTTMVLTLLRLAISPPIDLLIN
jgi:hypothetical protein